MKVSLAGGSLLLFGLSVVLLSVLTLSESALTGMSMGAERMIAFLFLILPAGAGAVLGVMSLVRRERRAWLAITGIILNALFALFHLMVVLFSG